jgi:hypothetical protein
VSGHNIETTRLTKSLLRARVRPKAVYPAYLRSADECRIPSRFRQPYSGSLQMTSKYLKHIWALPSIVFVAAVLIQSAMAQRTWSAPIRKCVFLEFTDLDELFCRV